MLSDKQSFLFFDAQIPYTNIPQQFQLIYVLVRLCSIIVPATLENPAGYHSHYIQLCLFTPETADVGLTQENNDVQTVAI